MKMIKSDFEKQFPGIHSQLEDLYDYSQVDVVEITEIERDHFGNLEYFFLAGCSNAFKANQFNNTEINALNTLHGNYEIPLIANTKRRVGDQIYLGIPREWFCYHFPNTYQNLQRIGQKRGIRTKNWHGIRVVAKLRRDKEPLVTFEYDENYIFSVDLDLYLQTPSSFITKIIKDYHFDNETEWIKLQILIDEFDQYFYRNNR